MGDYARASSREHVDRAESALEASSLMASLTEDERAVCVLVRLGFSIREIAEHREKTHAEVSAIWRGAVAKIGRR